MAVILNASTSTGFVQSADTSGILQLQSNGSTVLTVASTGVTATNIQGTIVQGTAVASTSGTSITFTSIPSWVKRITLNFVGVSQSGTTQMEVKLGTSGGVVSTGYVSGAASGLGATGSITSTTGFRIRNAVATDDIYGSMTINNQTGNTWVCSYSMAGSNGAFYTGAGSIALSGTLDRVQIAPNASDTFDAGTINIQYEG